jgi:hypothetical protein
MDTTEMEELATQVAYELTSLRGEGWRLDRTGRPDVAYPTAYLVGEDHAVLELFYGYHAPGKVTVTGQFPGTAGAFDLYRANIDPARGAEVVAREANRRVLEAGYLDVLPDKVARAARQAVREARRAQLMREAGALFGKDPRDDGDGGKLYLGEFVHGSGYVENYRSEPESLSFNLSGIPAATALRMLAVLAEDASGRNISAAS